MFVLLFCRFQSEFFRTSTARSEKFDHDFNMKIGILEPVTLKKPCLFRADFNHDFLHSGTPLLSHHIAQIAFSVMFITVCRWSGCTVTVNWVDQTTGPLCVIVHILKTPKTICIIFSLRQQRFILKKFVTSIIFLNTKWYHLAKVGS